MLAAILTLVLIGFILWVATQLRTDLFEQRLTSIKEDASFRFSQAQKSFDQSLATTPDQVQESTSAILGSTFDSARGAGAVGISLIPPKTGSAWERINPIGSPLVEDLVTPDMRADLGESITSAAGEGLRTRTAYWQSVELERGTSEPGVLVGALIDVQPVGESEMYILYSLNNEQQAVDTVIKVLLFGAIPVLLLMSTLTFYLVFRMLRPVRKAAEAAERLAEGDLDSRVDETGRDEMAMLGRAFNDMADSLSKQIHDYDDLSKLQQGFVSDVSHELRTPMTTIRMAEDMIYQEKDELSPAGRRSAELLHFEAERFEEMLADLLEISRFDAQSAKLDGESTDLYHWSKR